MATKFVHLTTLVLGVSLVASCGSKSSRLLDPYLSGPPILLTINGATLPSGPIGSTVMIEGANFGSFQGISGQVLFSDGAGGGVAATVAAASDWADDFIVASVPAGAATGPVWIRTAGGVSDSIVFTIAQNAAFSPSAIHWTGTTPLPEGLSGHAAAFFGPPGGGANSWVYVLGGADGTGALRGEVLYSQVQTGGALGSWNATTSLPAPVAFHAAVLATPYNSRIQATGYLYVLGGVTDVAGTSSNTIYRGMLNQDGTITSWVSAGTVPAAVHSLGAAIFHGDLYVAGGSTPGNVPVGNVYRARIDTSGALGAWQVQPSLPSARSYYGLLSFGGCLYSLGGDAGTVAPNDSTSTGTALNDVAFVKINLRTGDLAWSQWSSTSSLSKTRSKHTAVIGGGYVLVSSGIYNGAKTGSSEQSYAQLNGDGTLGSFNGATGSQTILSAGGRNLFNHAALGYTDPSGAAHVMVIGGDDLNLPGSKRAEIWIY